VASRKRARAQNALVFLVYALIAFGYFGWRVARHPGRDLIGTGIDPQIFVWAFAWWPHAIGTWQNPIVSHAIYAPHGIDLAWATSVPPLAVGFAPITLLFGPDVSYNVAATLMPALAAWTAYLLCRRVTGSVPASIVGGYLFGFSSYMLGQELGHLNLTAVFLIPLVPLVLVRYLQDELTARGLAWRLGLILGIQFWLSSEMLVTLLLGLAGGLVLTYWLVPSARRRLRTLAPPIGGAAALAVAVASPLLYYALSDFRSNPINSAPSTFDGDVLNFLLPTRLVAIGGSRFSSIALHFRGGVAEQGAYLGLPTLLIGAWSISDARRSAGARLLLAAGLLAAFATLGTAVVWRGHTRAWLPWKLLESLPVFDNILPSRFSAYLALAAALAVALWTSRRHGWLTRVLPALAVAAIVPAVWHADYMFHPERWGFFTDRTYRICFPKGQNVAIFPFGYEDESTLWQAESDFWFRMPGGYLAPDPPRASLADPTVEKLTFTNDFPAMSEILAMARRQEVDRIISVDIYVHPNGTEMHRFGAVQEMGGVLISPGCGYPSLREGVHPTPPHPSG
jgi:hypothetical protein